jgi:hypothetical protein
MRAIKVIAWIVGWFVACVCALWAFGALYFDFPIGAVRAVAAFAFVLVLLLAVIFVRGKFFKIAAVFVGFGAVVAWWLTLSPSNDEKWQPDVAETAWAEINGDDVTIHNVRNCDYRTEHDFDVHWEARTFQLSKMQGMDLAIMYWGSPYMAHPIVSFRFADALPICFSIETRKAVGQDYSAVRGLYRQYTLIYVVADERDSIRVRTNYREGEDVYFYRTIASPDQARERFVEYLNTVNRLHDHPRWYNAITTNCTTSIRTQRPNGLRAPWDWRILINGKADEMLYERHLIATGGLPFAELKKRSRINDAGRGADKDPEFSRRIRESIPGFQQLNSAR